MGLWAGIKYALNSTLGTDHFQPLDKIVLDSVYGKDEVYDSPGEYTIVKPAHAKGVVITACAGGGAGCNYYDAYNGAFGGGGGACVKDHTIYFDAAPNNEMIKVVVGKGGIVNTGSNQGGNGEATVIEGIITLPGGEGGYDNKAGTGSNPNGANGGTRTTNGGDSPYATGGKTVKYSSGAADGNNGTGGGASLGNGGDGGIYNGSSGNNVVARAGVLGGGGGGGYRNAKSAGAGGDGYVKLRWLF